MRWFTDKIWEIITWYNLKSKEVFPREQQIIQANHNMSNSVGDINNVQSAVICTVANIRDFIMF